MANQKDLTKELEKINIQIESIPEKEMNHIKNVNEWMEKKYNEAYTSLKEISKLNYSLRDYCKENNISRATLYKKNSNGESLYPHLLLYSESVKKNTLSKRKICLRNICRTNIPN